MIERVAVARAHQEKFVGVLRDFRKECGNLDARLAMPPEVPGGAASKAFVKSMRLVFRPFTKLPGSVFPDSRASSGFGSQVSTWETPPCMNRQMTFLARGVSCGVFGASGFVVARFQQGTSGG